MKLVGRIFTLLLLITASAFVRADSLDQLSSDFWAWRAVEQPISGDDIPRLERPAAWVPDWSAASVNRYRRQLDEFQNRWKKLDDPAAPVPRQVDYRLMGSAISRVRWELDYVHGWRNNAMFYVDQTAGAYFYFLLPPLPFDAARSQQLVAVLKATPGTLSDARKNLDQPAAPFARLAIDQLKDIRSKMSQSSTALKPLLDSSVKGSWDTAVEQAIQALESYRDWLGQTLPSMSQDTAVGRDAYVFFLKNVALIPYSPEKILAMGQQEWARSVASQVYEEHHNLGQPDMVLFKDINEQIAREAKDELAVRHYLEQKQILTVPASMQHYRFAAMPAYLGPMEGFGEADDFTGPSRLKDDCTRYITPPSPNLGYFALATAKDTRPEIAHEGVPGHYFQLALSWSNPDPIRRHYYDSGANEGIGFYAEEMLMHAGLFDDSPRTREIIWNFMRLRALRVEVDVKLALGQFSIEQGAEYLRTTVPMDSKTAHAEAAFFASIPGQAISYQIGKLQIMQFLAEARRQQADGFSLQRFHDFVWQNGNVPIALQRWEFLNQKNEVDALEKLQ